MTDLERKYHEAVETISDLISIIEEGPASSVCANTEDCYHCWVPWVLEKANKINSDHGREMQEAYAKLKESK